ncbi:phosphotransferase enzyme family protein [Candidatus Poriferisodalis sp.]|uniref:phosphotransferase enzyme family protein n=1 Tax=Candidatus Poriferisodalis sp. TaxID=3101277 RepID=UPI003B5962D7
MVDGAAAPYESPAREALRAFGLDSARLQLIGISENVTFRADDDRSPQAYVLRLHRPDYHTLGELNSERVWLEALRGSGISVPTPVAAPDGRYFVPVEIADDETRQVGLNLWAPGEIVGELLTEHGKSTDATEPAKIAEPFGQLGGLMAAMHNQAANWTPPSSFRRHRLDLDGLLGDAPFWGPFWDNPVLDGRERDLLITARNHCRELLRRYGEPRRTFSMIHADLHLANLLTHNGQLSVIDFDDAGFGWHQYDIAVAMFHSRGTADFRAGRQAFLHSYRAVRPISDDDLALVPMFELIRGMAILGWRAQRPEVPWPDGQLEMFREGVVSGCERLLSGSTASA